MVNLIQRANVVLVPIAHPTTITLIEGLVNYLLGTSNRTKNLESVQRVSHEVSLSSTVTTYVWVVVMPLPVVGGCVSVTWHEERVLHRIFSGGFLRAKDGDSVEGVRYGTS